MKTVLIIDDSHLGRTNAILALRGTGLRLMTARDGVEALTLARRHAPECVVVKQHMPALRAEEFIEGLRANATRSRVIVRGIAMTEQTVETYRAQGADVVLNGPLENEPVALREAIRLCTDETNYLKAV